VLTRLRASLRGMFIRRGPHPRGVAATGLLGAEEAGVDRG